TDHCSACMPPNEPPMMASQVSIPNRSESSAWVLTQSRTVTSGKSGPYGRLSFSGFGEVGPVEPLQPPILFSETTKNFDVSMALPGPIHQSHQPAFLSSS